MGKSLVKKLIKYCGTIVSVPENSDFGFIGINTVTQENGNPHELETDKDIFLHSDDCENNCPLSVGTSVLFYINDDIHRGEGHYRAFGATEIINAEMVPADEFPIEGFNAMTTVDNHGLIEYPRTDYHINAKHIPEEEIEKVLGNDPFSEISPVIVDRSEEEKKRLLACMLKMFFPALSQFNANYDSLSEDDSSLDEAVIENEKNLSELDMDSQIEDIRKEVIRFKSLKHVLKLLYDNDLVRTDTIIPIKYLPDLFMAVPVWYFWVEPNKIDFVEQRWRHEDPKPQEEIIYFCNLFPNQKWCDVFQMFNRRIRSLKRYKGDKIPPLVSQRLLTAIKAFDYVVIATPNHSEAGQDWQDLEWLQMIDPYVLGFKKGIPHIFVLARFSDSGTFPLYLDMVADTIDFLHQNKQKLSGFNEVHNPYWYQVNTKRDCVDNLGDKLIQRTDELINAYEMYDLFNWLKTPDEPEVNDDNENHFDNI